MQCFLLTEGINVHLRHVCIMFLPHPKFGIAYQSILVLFWGGGGSLVIEIYLAYGKSQLQWLCHKLNK